MSEPTTPTGRAFVGVDEMHEYTQSHRRAIAEAIEREARAMTLHEACEAEWKRRDAAHPGIDQTLHDWRAHLEAPTDE